MRKELPLVPYVNPTDMVKREEKKSIFYLWKAVFNLDLDARYLAIHQNNFFSFL